MHRVLTSEFRARVRHARRLALRGAAISAAVPVGLGIAVTAADKMRKQRDVEDSQAPADPPRSAQVRGNELTTYTYGQHLYDDMLAAIDGAQHYVYLASYIWKGDRVGQAFKDAIRRAADRGVVVCLVYDGFANLVVHPLFHQFPDNVHVLRFPLVRSTIPVIDVRRSGRDHRKILVVDGTIGFVGGYNIGSLYAKRWRDTHLRIVGPGVWELQNAFVDFWNRHRRRHLPRLPDSGSPHWDIAIKASRNEPSRIVFPVRALYLEAIDRAMHRIWITQGYFIPDREILQGLLAAAERGVDVRVIMPDRSNHVVADLVARSFFNELLAGGVRVFLYRDVMVHAKTATVDGVWATIGTANIDRLSLRGNYEINLEITDPEQARHMELIFRRDLEFCRELTAEEWSRRRVRDRVVERVLRPLQILL